MTVRQYEACLDNFCKSHELCEHRQKALDRWAKAKWDEVDGFTDSSQLFDLLERGLEELIKPVAIGTSVSLIYLWGVVSIFLRTGNYHDLGLKIAELGTEIADAIWEVLKSHGISLAEILGLENDDEVDLETFRRLMETLPDAEPPTDPNPS